MVAGWFPRRPCASDPSVGELVSCLPAAFLRASFQAMTSDWPGQTRWRGLHRFADAGDLDPCGRRLLALAGGMGEAMMHGQADPEAVARFASPGDIKRIGLDGITTRKDLLNADFLDGDAVAAAAPGRGTAACVAGGQPGAAAPTSSATRTACDRPRGGARPTEAPSSPRRDGWRPGSGGGGTADPACACECRPNARSPQASRASLQPGQPAPALLYPPEAGGIAPSCSRKLRRSHVAHASTTFPFLRRVITISASSKVLFCGAAVRPAI